MLLRKGIGIIKIRNRVGNMKCFAPSLPQKYVIIPKTTMRKEKAARECIFPIKDATYSASPAPRIIAPKSEGFATLR